MGNPTLNLTNQFGEVSENVVGSSDGQTYEGTGHSFQVIGPDLNLAVGVGSDDVDDPKFIATIMGNIIGEDLTESANYLAGVIGAYTIAGTKASTFPTGGVIGIIMDGVTDVDGAVVAHIDGDSGVVTAGAAFKATMKNSTAGSGVNYGLDLYYPAANGYLALGILKADLRLSNQVCVFSGATAPVNGTTGDNFAGPGSIYIARDSGLFYQQTGLITDPTWVAAGSAGTGALLTSFSSGAGTVAGTDTILQGINKLSGNLQNKTVLANVLTGFVAGAGVVANTDTVLQGIDKLAGNDVQLKNGTFTPAPETVSVAGAISTTLMESILANAAGAPYAATLAAPSSQDGQLKVLKMTTATNPVTLACTNILFSGAYTPTGTTTLTFTNTGDCAVLMAVGAKWVYLGGSAVAS